MADFHPVCWSNNLFAVYTGHSRIQQRPIGHKHDCLRSAHVDIRNLPLAAEKKTLNHNLLNVFFSSLDMEFSFGEKKACL